MSNTMDQKYETPWTGVVLNTEQYGPEKEKHLFFNINKIQNFGEKNHLEVKERHAAGRLWGESFFKD